TSRRRSLRRRLLVHCQLFRLAFQRGDELLGPRPLEDGTKFRAADCQFADSAVEIDINRLPSICGLMGQVVDADALAVWLDQLIFDKDTAGYRLCALDFELLTSKIVKALGESRCDEPTECVGQAALLAFGQPCPTQADRNAGHRRNVECLVDGGFKKLVTTP